MQALEFRFAFFARDFQASLCFYQNFLGFGKDTGNFRT
jgi:catechol 2,3-dioxygenase-like lactoylglutathione lyase family enzyme